MENYNVFAGAFVDRSGERRKDPDWLTRAVVSEEARFVPVWGDLCLVGGDPPHAVRLKRAEVEGFVDEHNLIFLGLFRNQPAFALAIESDREQPFSEYGTFENLRFLGTRLPLDEANLVAHARALVLWHASQSYCGICGSPALPHAGGNTRRCVNADCATEIFPRTDPAVIVLVHDGDRCLLGRQESWPEDRYSTVAGFVEPGESLEDAVRREVFEETNVRVAAVNYHSSQPWPFPSSLMLGFIAEASTGEIRLNDGELQDAQWFTRDQLRSGFPKLPFRISIARRLVDHWIMLGDDD
ncbi:MAG: NAD(+) diphosphatase [Gammaproteobacteria bacterium]|nr:NAD(+) diphosphatase [Gammaproteobacteria bacterium]NNC57295.1 NAD(+) diphosphatase [Woeseiaceae bacterium]NNL52198.1 NAD(+) diphosphatase [Woeseiaceae bacterium]